MKNNVYVCGINQLKNMKPLIGTKVQVLSGTVLSPNDFGILVGVQDGRYSWVVKFSNGEIFGVADIALFENDIDIQANICAYELINSPGCDFEHLVSAFKQGYNSPKPKSSTEKLEVDEEVSFYDELKKHWRAAKIHEVDDEGYHLETLDKYGALIFHSFDNLKIRRK